MAYRGREAEKEEVKRSPYMVTYRNYKTGLVEKQDPYILRFVGEGGNKTQLLERPAGSGNLWDARTGETPVGRWDKSKPEGERYLKDAAHIEWKAPETQDQKLAKSLVEKDEYIKELERELEAIKAEKEKKSSKDKGA